MNNYMYEDYKKQTMDQLSHSIQKGNTGTDRVKWDSGLDGDIEELHDVSCKVMLIGDSGVGKTCLLVRFKDNTFLSGSFISTVGVDFRNKVVQVEGKKVKMQIWDTAGQERFRSLTRAYYRDADALLLVYDATRRASFENVRAWLTEVREYARTDATVLLLGNKCDVDAPQRAVSPAEGQQLARDNNIAFLETSAKTGTNVNAAFSAVAADIVMATQRRQGRHGGDRGHGGVVNVGQYVEQGTQETGGRGCCTL